MVPWAHPSPHPKIISIGSAVLAALMIVSDRQINRQIMPVATGHINVVLR